MADHQAPLHFGPFSLHPVQGLMRNEQEIRVTPRSLDLLVCLAARAGEIVTKDELFRSVWQGRVVTDAALTTCIRELRHALGDDARRPRYIETVHRRGYRLLVVPESRSSVENGAGEVSPVLAAHTPLLEQLLGMTARVEEGGTVAAMLCGPAGSGKTPLAQAFLGALAEAPQPWQACTTWCNDHARPGDAFRPLLDLLTRLTKLPGRAATVLSSEASTWFAELPVDIARRERRILRLRASGATRQRRDRELFDALTTLSTINPLVLVVEDVQYCDAATADLLAKLAVECRGNVLLIMTCRPDELSPGSALHDFRSSPECTLLELEPAGAAEPATTDHRRTLNAQSRHLLESASIAGKRFTTAEAAAGADVSVEEADALLVQLSDAGHGIRCGSKISWPDGTVTRAFEFRDPMLRKAILDVVPQPRRAAAHRRIGRRLEKAHRDRAEDIAAQLAVHCELSGDYDQALKHHYEAGVVARRRSAPEVALDHFRRALALVPSLPASQRKDLWEADLWVAVGRELIAAHGLASDEARAAYQRASELQRGVGEDGPALQRVRWGLWVHLLNSGPRDAAQQAAGRLLDLARANGDTDELLQAHHAHWSTALMLGDMNAVLSHARQGIALCAAETDEPVKMTTGCTFHDVHLNDHSAAVCAGTFCAWADAFGGRKEAAVQNLNAAISHARDVDQPFTLACSLTVAAGAMTAANDPGLTCRFAKEARSIASFQGFGLIVAWASAYEGWALAHLGEMDTGLGQLLEALETSRAFGVTLFRPFQLALAADLQLDNGQLEGATRLIDEAFVISERAGERLALPELYRIRGELRTRTAAGPETLKRAVGDLTRARDIATEQGATLLAAKATASLQQLQNRQADRQ